MNLFLRFYVPVRGEHGEECSSTGVVLPRNQSYIMYHTTANQGQTTLYLITQSRS